MQKINKKIKITTTMSHQKRLNRFTEIGAFFFFFFSIFSYPTRIILFHDIVKYSVGYLVSYHIDGELVSAAGSPADRLPLGTDGRARVVTRPRGFGYSLNYPVRVV